MDNTSVGAEEHKSVLKVVQKKSSKKIVIGSISLDAFSFALSYAVSQYIGPFKEPEALEKSIAVLPFVDMSPGKDQEYLADGIAEDIITALSRINELKVIGRTSSFQFKGEKIDLREVGEKLNVSTVLEGSIMKIGKQGPHNGTADQCK